MRPTLLRVAALSSALALLPTAAWAEGIGVNVGGSHTDSKVTVELQGIARTTAPGVPGSGCTSNCVVVIQWESVIRLYPEPTSPTGECFGYVWYTTNWLDARPDRRMLFDEENKTSEKALTSDPAPTRCPGRPGVDPRTIELPFLEQAAAEIDPPTPRVQPDNRALTGQRSYLVGEIPPTMTKTVSFEVPDDPVAGTTQRIEATITATLDHYLVDWDWDGTSTIDEGAASDTTRMVTGPHAADDPRGWEADSEVSAVYTHTGSYLVAVQPVWDIEVSVLGRTITGVRRTTPATVAVTAQQAQAVRRS